MLSITIGLILHSIARRSQELATQLDMLREEWGRRPEAEIRRLGDE
jgi:hypothetical protein